MRFRVEFEVEETDDEVTEQELIDYLNYELGVKPSISTKNPWCCVDMSKVIQNLKITKKHIFS